MVLRSTIALSATAAAAAGMVGVEFGSEPFPVINMAYNTRTWVSPTNTSNNVATDENGWPLADAFTVVFDNRPFPAWNPPLDDPWGWYDNMTGSYYFNISGKATVALNNDPGMKGVTLANVTFDAATWTTAGYFIMAPGGTDLVELIFTDTQRTATSGTNSGFSGFRVIPPGFDPASDGMALRPDVLALVKPFDHVRFMGITGTNTQPGYYGDVGHHILAWTDRCLMTDAIVGVANRPGCWGLPWEWVVQLAQATGKGVWVNAPISASGHGYPFKIDTTSYLYQWATLLKAGNAFTGGKGVPASSAIYVEDSNEVWNFGFGQYIWNKLAAIEEVNVTKVSNLNNDGSTDPEVWTRRRHLRSLYEIGQTFAAVFGASALNQQIRPIYAHWPIFPDQYNETLTWFANTYGPPSKYIWGISITTYFGSTPKAGDSVDAVIAGYLNSTANQYAMRQKFSQLAKYWGLQLTAYEGGPGWGVGDTTDIGNVIIAQRQEGMRGAVSGDIASYFQAGGDSYNYFSLCGKASRYGQWGAIEFLSNITTPKYCGVLDAMHAPLPKGC